jgi:hypothetical protein
MDPNSYFFLSILGNVVAQLVVLALLCLGRVGIQRKPIITQWIRKHQAEFIIILCLLTTIAGETIVLLRR